ncbi:MAG: tyrosine-type recombinase/integrase [Clostridia bacterium]
MRAEGLTRLWYWNTRRGWGSSTPRPAPTLRWRRSTAFSAFGALKAAASEPFKVQKAVYCPEEKELTREEYVRLVQAAKEKSSERLALLLESICATGIRVSELQFITVEAVSQGEAIVTCKGKTRTVFYPPPCKRSCGGIFKARKSKAGRCL